MIDALLGLCTPPVVVSNILVGIAHKLRDFRLAHMSHVKCQGSKPTHILAKYANEVENSDNYVIWVEENPLPIGLAITHDVMNLSS